MFGYPDETLSRVFGILLENYSFNVLQKTQMSKISKALNVDHSCELRFLSNSSSLNKGRIIRISRYFNDLNSPFLFHISFD